MLRKDEQLIKNAANPKAIGGTIKSQNPNQQRPDSARAVGGPQPNYAYGPGMNVRQAPQMVVENKALQTQ